MFMVRQLGGLTIHIMVGVTGRSSVDRHNFNQPQIRLYFSIGEFSKKRVVLKRIELRAARFVRKFLYKNSYALKAACFCASLFRFFETYATRLTQTFSCNLNVTAGCILG